MSTRRYRSSIACKVCRQRKVRCSLNVTGVPCSNCAQDRAECTVEQRKPRARRQDRSLVAHCPTPRGPEGESTPSPAASAARSSYGSGHGSTQLNEALEQTPPSIERNNAQDSGRDGVEIVTAAFGRSQRSDRVPFYAGEQTGIMSVLDICTPQQQSQRHFLIPSNVSMKSLSNEDREYLRAKGVFSFPGKDACNHLLYAYFHHVHPIMPVVDASVVLEYHRQDRLYEYNLSLLWSMFFVAVNFISADIWKLEGYASQKDMKATMYSRAKCAYNNGGETDKVVLLQSTLLMGFWHSDKDDHSQPWYWTGISISLCQILGLHQDPDSVKHNSSFSDRRRHLWRRIWWSCFFRDRWLSLTMGRPLRINLNDCDTPMPSASDVLDDLSGLPELFITDLVPQDLPQLAEHWVILIEMSKLLGTVLTLIHAPLGNTPPLHQVEAVEMELLRSKAPDRPKPGWSSLATFSFYHLQLHYQALSITFYRPYGTKVPDGLLPAHQQEWHQGIRLKVESAALQTNAILDALARDNLLKYAGPMTPPLLLPAMHTHLLNYQSERTLSRRLAHNKLDLCLTIMGEMQETYASAAIFRGIFLEAIRRLCPEYHSGASAAPPPSGPHSQAVVSAATPSAIASDGPVEIGGTPPFIADGIVDALMDEVSMFNFWETFSRM